jgi:hypothetical protein
MRPLGIVLSVALCTCVPSTHTVPLGSPLPARAFGCPVSFERVVPSDAAARWREIGVVCLVKGGGGEFTIEEAYAPGDLRDALNEEACKLGGEFVSPVGTCANSKLSGTEFGVYASRTTPDAGR